MPNQPTLLTRHVSVRPFGYLLAAVAATACNLTLSSVGYQHTIVTGMLVGAACAGVVCWRQALAEERTRRELRDTVAELTTAIEALASQTRVAYVPAPRASGHMYVSQWASGDTWPSMPAVSRPVVDEDVLRVEVERVVAEELGTRESVRAQGYAEGYVDGFDRRKDDDPSS